MEEYIPSESVKFSTYNDSVFKMDKAEEKLVEKDRKEEIEEKYTRIEIEEEEEKNMLSNDPGVYTIDN